MFHRCKTAQEAQSLFLILALRFHPSNENGSFELFALAQEAYEKFLEDINAEKPESKREFLLPGKYQFTETEVTLKDTDKNEILLDIEAFAMKNPRFDTKFFKSVCEHFNTREYLSIKQYNALVKIYYQFKMNEKAIEA